VAGRIDGADIERDLVRRRYGVRVMYLERQGAIRNLDAILLASRY
jgi:hypothetical protein